MKNLTIILTCIMFSWVLAGAALADENQGTWINSNDYRDNALILSVDKLGRGLVNTIFGVVEIPKQSVKRAIDTKTSYGYASGFVLGIGYFILRELAGVYEIVTFPVPVPSGYAPIIDPILGYKPKTLL